MKYTDDLLIREMAEKTSLSMPVVKAVYEAFKESLVEAVRDNDEVSLKDLFKIRCSEVRPYKFYSRLLDKTYEKDNVVRVIITPSNLMRDTIKSRFKIKNKL